MNVTPSSTSGDDRERERREGSVLWGRTRALLDELDELRAKQPDPVKAAARKARADNARLVLTARLHACIDAAVERHRLQLTRWTGSANSRAEWLARQMKIANKNRRGKKARVPSAAYVAEYLETLGF